MTWNQKIHRESKLKYFQAWLVFCISIFLILSLYSYNPEDSSLNSFGLFLKVTNYCGFVGASLADVFYQLFGFSSWLFIFWSLHLCYILFFKYFRRPVFYSLTLFFLFMSSFAGLGELYLPNLMFFDSQVSLGGVLGKFIVGQLHPLFHTIGTTVILGSGLLLILTLYGQMFFPRFLIPSAKKLFFYFLYSCKSLPVWLWAFLIKIKHFLSHNLLSKIIVYKPFFLLKKWILAKKHSPLTDKISPSANIKKTSKDLKFSFKEEKALNEKTKESLSEKNLKSTSAQDSLKKEGIQAKMNPQKGCSFLSSHLFKLPSIDILSESPLSGKKITHHDVEDLSKKLISKLKQFSIHGEIKAVKTGPAVVFFEFKPEDHIKVSRIREMESDLSLALSSESIRIIAPIPGRDVVGIEASRPYREMVYLKNLLCEKSFFQSDLPLILGHRADNTIGIRDLSRMPHLLVAGTTGSGKSMFIISFIISLLFRHTPETLRVILIDPKQVDLSSFKGIPHLLSPIISSINDTLKALFWAVEEMEKRYRSMSLFGARDIKSFNEKVTLLNSKEKEQHREKNETADKKESYYFKPLPLICIVVEEFGDLMADRNSRRPIENAIVRLAQKARASGLHLVLAMQSPRKDVVTGLIKTNIPGRISFKVASGTDSRVILDEAGAEKLLSHGDMLFLEPGTPKPIRYHGPFVREKDVTEIVTYWKEQGKPFYESSFTKELQNKDFRNSKTWSDIKEDPKYNEILNFVKSCDVISASFLQRKFHIGYPRAARMIEVLFEEGQIGPPQGSKPREVLINK